MVSPEYMSESVLGGLVSAATGPNLNRHGAILAVAHISHALAIVAKQQNTPLQSFISKLISLFSHVALRLNIHI